MGLEPPCPHRDSRSNRALAHSVPYMWQPSPGARFLCPLLAFCAKHSTGGAAAEALTPDASPGAQGLALCPLLSPRARPGGQRRTAGTSAGDSVLAQVWETRPTFLWSCGHTGQLAEATARTQRGSHGAGGTGSLPQESCHPGNDRRWPRREMLSRMALFPWQSPRNDLNLWRTPNFAVQHNWGSPSALLRKSTWSTGTITVRF